MRMREQFPITDGFTFSRNQRCAYTFRDVATQEYEALRRAGGYRFKTWLCPTDSNAILIPAFGSYEYQITKMKPGSAIWGYSFFGQSAPGVAGSGILGFNIRDGCSDVPLFSEVAIGTLSSPQFQAVPTRFLTKLLIIGAPGLINVEMTNTYNTAQQAQLALYGGEPAW
jgi:hypothetical protein